MFTQVIRSVPVPAVMICKTVGSIWLRARYRPPGYRVGPGEIFARQVDEVVVDDCLTGNLRWCCGVLRSAGRAGACWSGLGRGSPCQRIEGPVDGGLGDVGEAEVVVAGIGPQPGEGLVQMEAGAF